MQAGLRVATQGLRPEIPVSVDPEQARLIRDCWAPVPDQRPSFHEVRTAVGGAHNCLPLAWGTCTCVRAQQGGLLSQSVTLSAPVASAALECWLSHAF